MPTWGPSQRWRSNLLEPVLLHGAGWVVRSPEKERPRVTGTIDRSLLDDLVWRGLIAHSTDLGALRQALTSESVRFYVASAPPAPTLHIGNLVQLATAPPLQNAGH